MPALYGAVFSEREIDEVYGMQYRAKDLLSEAKSNYQQFVRQYFDSAFCDVFQLYYHFNIFSSFVIGKEWEKAPGDMTIQEVKSKVEKEIAEFFPHRTITCTSVFFKGDDY